ncbi:MAG: class I SAM-dependent methyltransferase [Anaerolineae bacterium]|nr:class I SAM-dependent methyltransferase [Anaerolineae bacterium]
MTPNTLKRFKRSTTNWWNDGLRVAFIRRVTSGASTKEIRAYINEIEMDTRFIGLLRQELQTNTTYQPSPKDFMLFNPGGSMFFYAVLMYALVRILKPEIVVETGGTPGKTSAFFLQAMEQNGRGQLYTIDFPPAAFLSPAELDISKTHHYLPTGKGSGWIVPDDLKHRQKLIVGKSIDHLPELLESLSEVDIFLHDGGHEYENMMWEYELVWPYLKSGSLLLSDDIQHNTAWQDFCVRQALTGVPLVNLGGLVKP